MKYDPDGLRELAQRLDAEVRPNAYAVIHLNKNIIDQYGSYCQVDDPSEHYDGIAKQFLSNLSRKIYGQTVYRRGGRKLLPNFVTLEGDGVTKVYHLNILMRRPEWIDWPDFKDKFYEAFDEQVWFRKGKNALFIEERTGDSPSYNLKTGTDSVLWSSFTRA